MSGALDAPGTVAAALEPLVDQLESTARELAGGGLDGPEAAAVVERSAELAARLGLELDAQARARPDDQGALAQERLL